MSTFGYTFKLTDHRTNKQVTYPKFFFVLKGNGFNQRSDFISITGSSF
ncbi:hypothetical protein SAMN04488066_10685 [Halorubrum aquaticum]|uniref:Uncharacterized protein n=1 Tax=Halorubrum aquaticum TaxID=387340 RepID=A0A1I3AKW6_9EURY|nr:hypothetical protein SAMN04488066_10685 [Halorubrum aquaticum]